ncbi:MAG: sigma-70 family RNA polymerase sigma factor [Anaerolineae bacterium]|nr:sigma-70 family RNA polymerase sigma factor [Anaerolineae bacterium]
MWTPEHETQLIERAQQGDQAAFGELYDHYLTKVYRRVYALVPESDVEDVTQEIFISVARSLSSFRGGSKFSTWLYRIVKRRVADYYRKGERQVEQVEIEKADHVAGANPFGDKADELLLRQAMRALPESHREIILLRLAEGLPFQDVADRLGIKLGAAKVRFYRAITACQEQIIQLEPGVTF